MPNPTLVSTPFANTGTKNDIPDSGATQPQLATMQAGFPAITQVKISEGGIPPERADFNGILNLYGQHVVHLNKGLPYEYDAAFASQIGGYPLHARIMLTSGDIVQCTTANNTNDPNVNMSGWVSNSKVKAIKSIAELLSIPSPTDGSFVNVLSYYEGQNKGGDSFYYDSSLSSINNGVTVFNGWVRLYSGGLSADKAGLTGLEPDCYVKFQSLIDASVYQDIDLNGLTLKMSQIDLPSNITIINGGIDVSASTWDQTYGRAAIMFKSTPRDASGVDYEADAVYSEIPYTYNISFKNINFIGNKNCALLFKFDGISFIDCSGTWNKGHLFKFVGGWNGTPLVNDSPTSYNLINPKNGRCKNILIDNCQWHGGYTDHSFSSPFRFIACEKCTINGGINDSPLGWLIDIYNKDFTLNNADYINTNMSIVTDSISGVAEADMLAIYIGQNTYDIKINGARWYDYGRKGIYIEVGSQVYINNIVSRCSVANNIATFADVQANYRDNANTYIGNCADITFSNISSTGSREGINITPINGMQSIKNVNVSNANISVNSNVEALVIRGLNTANVHEFHTNGSLYIGANLSNVNIKSSSFNKQSNYALYVADMGTASGISIKDTDFVVNSGSAIYNNGGGSNTLIIDGGKIISKDGSPRLSKGITPCALTAYNFDFGGAKFIPSSRLISLATGEKTSFYITSAFYKSGWMSNTEITGGDAQGVDLSIRESVGNGSAYITIENRGAPISSLTINFITRFTTYLDNDYLS